jgi:hypothetical protein
MKFLISLVLALVVSDLRAQTPTPVWELGKNSIDPKFATGKVEVIDGMVMLDGANTFSLPSTLLGNQIDYTIEFEVKRPADAKQGCGFVLVSNADDKNGAGIAYTYFPPEYNAGWISKNGHRTVEQRGLLNDAFNKMTLVVKDKQLMQFRNGLLLAVTDAVNPSSRPLTFGGMVDAKRPPQCYSFRNIRIYDRAIFPTGFDPSAQHLRYVSGDQYAMQRVDVKDPSLPRILVVGDSISMGYRSYVSEHFKGRAYVDYWVGSGCSWYGKPLDDKDSTAARAWNGVLSNGPYDVVSWNAMTLHWWTPGMPERCPEGSLAARMAEAVEYVKRTAPKARFIWVRCTPIRASREDGSPTLDNPGNERIVRFNAIVDDVMKQQEIPEVDLYAIAAQQLHTVRNGSQDTVHWSAEVSRLFADAIIREIDKCLPEKPAGKPASAP